MAFPGTMSFSDIRATLVLLGLFRFSEAVAWTSIFPYVYSMIQRFPHHGRSDPAFITGLFVAVFTFCEFLSGSFWAGVSDIIGRKPTLLIGAACGALTALGLGVSGAVWMAVLVRAFGGLTNSIEAVLPTCVGELATDKAHQGLRPYSPLLVVEILTCRQQALSR